MKKKKSYHFIKNTTETGFILLCGISIHKKAIGERLITNEKEKTTCPMCKILLNK